MDGFRNDIWDIVAGSLGGLGAGLVGAGLKYGAERRNEKQQQKEMQRQFEQRVQSYSQALGITPDQAVQLASLPDKMQQDLFTRLLESGGGNAPMQGIGEITQSPQQQMFGQPQQIAAPEMAVFNQLVPKFGMGQPQQLGMTLERMPQQAQQQPQIPMQQPQSIMQRIQQNLTPEEKKQAIKDTATFVTKTNDAYKDSRKNNMRLNRMEELLKGKGEKVLAGPLKSSAVEWIRNLPWIGVDLSGVFLNPESQEFNKISADFLREAKSIFGSRLTNYDVQSFLKIIPTLSQSKEGRRRIIRNMKLFNAGEVARKKVMDQIIEQNNGRKPYNLPELVEQRVEPLLDKIAQEFESGISIKNLEAKEEKARRKEEKGQIGQGERMLRDIKNLLGF
jgi:hypothetical protein